MLGKGAWPFRSAQSAASRKSVALRSALPTELSAKIVIAMTADGTKLT
jgi:hypothetical protein